jgi:hypothetical protein
VCTAYHIVSLCRENPRAVVHYVHPIPLSIIPVGVQIGVQKLPELGVAIPRGEGGESRSDMCACVPDLGTLTVLQMA